MAKSTFQVHEFASALVTAGVVREEDLNNIERIVIDADASNGLVRVYIVRIGDDPTKIAEAIAPVLKGIM